MLTLRNTVDRTEYTPSVNMTRGKSGIYLRLYVKLPAGMRTEAMNMSFLSKAEQKYRPDA